ncbi:MAG: glycine--tRNA ligase, partial [Firmicutes bacterium]|nr:glycine--tRNA ligase [Bacillota bacterium]
MTVTMEKLVALAKHRGFIFPGSELYGGLANSWDFGPLGVELKQNLKRLYWQRFVQEADAVVGLDSAILMNRDVWVASGHVGNFSDPLTDCRACKTRHRADKLLEAAWQARGSDRSADGLEFAALDAAIKESGVRCPDCGASDFTPVRQFNMMFRTHLGVTDEAASEVFLRPETAQGIFINFKNVMRSMRLRLPFGIAQIGKSFRNEIT